MSIAAGLAVGAVFVRRQLRLADPMIDLSLFRVPAFNAALSANTFGFFVNFRIAVFIAQYLQLVLGLSPFEAGLWTVPYASAFIVGSLLTPVLVASIRPAFVIAGGLALSARPRAAHPRGRRLLACHPGDWFRRLRPRSRAGLHLGRGHDGGFGAAGRAGAAAGISETSSEFGGALGIAVLGAVGTAVYRGEIDSAVPTGIPPQAAEAARDTLGAAVAAGDALPGRLAPELVTAAQQAFTEALQVAATLSAAVAVGAAILTAALLQRVRMGSGLEQGTGLEPDRARWRAGGRAEAMSLSRYKVRTSIAVSDIARAAEFYEGKLGLRAAVDQDDGSRIYECGGDTSLHVYVSPAHAARRLRPWPPGS